ncbi:unnamed protein product [Meganyctiphanes norvegica]|uniref:Uncharacterized protein n=1 Tax=Meganyctiphanes norvegica TaxID=48144 RepID=A0AAV2PSZ2_MEGNR
MCGGGRRSRAICYEGAQAPGRIPDCLPLWLIQVLYVWLGMSSSSAGGGAMAAARDRAQRYNPTSECNQYPASERSQYLSSERTYPQQQHKGFNPLDDTLAFPVQIALPDGEDIQNPSSTVKLHRTPEQEEELKRPYIKPPPNRNFFDIGQCGPPTRPSSVGVGLAEMRTYTNIQNVGSSREKEKEYYRHSAPLESRPTSLWSGDDGGRSSPKRGRKPTRNIIDKCIAPFTSPKCDRGVHLGSQMETGGLTIRPKGIRHHNQSAAPGTGTSSSCPSSSPPPDVNSPLLVHSGVSRMLEEIPVLSCNPHANTSIPQQCYQQSSQCYQHYGMGSSGASSSFTDDLRHSNPAEATDDRGANSETGVHCSDRTTTHLTHQIDIYEHTSHCISDDSISEHDPPPLYYEVIEHPRLYRNVSSSRSSRQSEQRTSSGKI